MSSEWPGLQHCPLPSAIQWLCWRAKAWRLSGQETDWERDLSKTNRGMRLLWEASYVNVSSLVGWLNLAGLQSVGSLLCWFVHWFDCLLVWLFLCRWPVFFVRAQLFCARTAVLCVCVCVRVLGQYINDIKPWKDPESDVWHHLTKKFHWSPRLWPTFVFAPFAWPRAGAVAVHCIHRTALVPRLVHTLFAVLMEGITVRNRLFSILCSEAAGLPLAYWFSSHWCSWLQP